MVIKTSASFFPALLIAGPPNSGKSVFAYALSQYLRKAGVQHYLLRAAPDGEGDWFFEGSPSVTRVLRYERKRPFTDTFVFQTWKVIHNRHLPLLVDIGGKPRDTQFSILRECTHAILLYKTKEDQQQWRAWLREYALQCVAELNSVRDAEDERTSGAPVIEGVIGGLEREISKRRLGTLFGATAETVARIFSYDPAELRAAHLSLAPFQGLSETELARRIGKSLDGAAPRWFHQDLFRLDSEIPAQEAYALYGRGPVWLTAFLSAKTMPAPLALFDVRFGWVTLPAVRNVPPYRLNLREEIAPDAQWLIFEIPALFLEKGEVSFPSPRLDGRRGVILSGALPKWVYAALTREFAAAAPWVAVYDPALDAAVLVFSRVRGRRVGELLSSGGGAFLPELPQIPANRFDKTGKRT